jgi:hypothetical protein
MVLLHLKTYKFLCKSTDNVYFTIFTHLDFGFEFEFYKINYDLTDSTELIHSIEYSYFYSYKKLSNLLTFFITHSFKKNLIKIFIIKN